MRHSLQIKPLQLNRADKERVQVASTKQAEERGPSVAVAGFSSESLQTSGKIPPKKEINAESELITSFLVFSIHYAAGQ